MRLPRFSFLDFKVGFRILARYPGLTVVATIAIAVAIALGSVYFEAVNKWQNPRLPIADAGRVLQVRLWDVEKSFPEARLLHDFANWRGQVKTIVQLGAAINFERNLTIDGGPIEPVQGAEISASAFTLVGTPPQLGRTLTPRDEQASEPPVVVISHTLWKSRFNGDAAVLGKSVKLGSVNATVVGVMPPGFGFPMNQRIWAPLRADGATLVPRTGPSVTVFGRLAPDATFEDAGNELTVIGARLATSSPETHKHLRPVVTTYAKPISNGEMLIVRNIVYAVNVVFLLLLAVICTNVATLVFARTATRGWELTVRSALGASRGRIVSQLFIEALVLAALAAVVGLGAARAGMGYAVGQFAASDALPFWIDASLSWQTVVYTALLTFVGAAIVGILPALRVTRINVNDALRNESAARSGLKFGGFWTAVIVVQVAITVAFLPLAASGVFMSNRFAQRAEGIDADKYITASVGVDRENYVMDSATFNARAKSSFAELERRLRLEPGVEQVAFSDRLPVEDQFKYVIEKDTLAGAPTTGIRVSTLVHVSAGFFEAYGSSVVSGRGFVPLDFETGHVMIVNQSFVKAVLGDRNPIGQRIRLVEGEVSRDVGPQWYEIVGMVKDFGWQLPEPQEQAAMYRPALPVTGRASQIAVRVRDADAFGARLRSVAAEADPTIRLSDVKPLRLAGGGEAQGNWALTSVAFLIGFIVLLLSATGIHSLMSFTVSRRTREIGIRAALGASPARIVRGIFSRAFIQISIGVVAGSALAAVAGLDSARAVLILLGADAIMLVVGLTACWVPLRRALRIDPTEALRAEG